MTYEFNTEKQVKKVYLSLLKRAHNEKLSAAFKPFRRDGKYCLEVELWNPFDTGGQGQ